MGMTTDGVNDRGDLGPLGDWGSYMNNVLGFSQCVWLKLGADSTDSVAALFPSYNHDSITDAASGLGASQSSWWGLNMGYTSGIVNSVGAVLYNLGDHTDTGFLCWQDIGNPTFNDQGWHHHCITVKPMNLGSRQVLYYMDGVLRAGPTWANFPFNDTMGGCLDFTRSPTIAARTLTNATSWFDFTQGEWEDARLYKRILTPGQIMEIAGCYGGDSISDYYRRWTMATNGRDLSPALAPLTAQNGAAFANVIRMHSERRRAA